MAEPGRFTIDASVFVSALRGTDPAHGQSVALLENSDPEASFVIVPNLVKPEVAGAISRATGDTGLARRALEMLSEAPRFTLAALDDNLAEVAAELAIGARLRGADAVYAATARHFDSTLITLDNEQRTRLPADITVLYPAEALEA